MKSVSNWLRDRSLHSNDSNTRIAAIDKLAETGEVDSEPLLLEALNDTNMGVRTAAAGALGAVGGTESIAPLLQICLQEKDMGIRQEAISSLEKIDLTSAMEFLLGELDNEDVPIAQAAGWSLRKLAWNHLDDTQKARVAIVRSDWDNVADYGMAAVEPLEKAFRDGTDRTRADAAEALGQIGTDEAIHSLVALLGDYELKQGSRELAGRALRRYSGDELTDAQNASICITLGEWDAVVTLGAAAVKPLASALPYPTLCNHAARSLIRIGPAGLDALVSLVKNPDVLPAVREAASIALAEISDSRAVGPLMLMLTDSDMAVRQTAVWTLERLGWQPDNPGQHALVAIAHDDWEAVQGLGVGAVEPLLCMATDSMISSEGLAVLESILEEGSRDITPNQLRTLASLSLAKPVPSHVGVDVNVQSATPDYSRLVKLAKALLFKRGLI